MTFIDELHAHLVVHYKIIEKEQKRLFELEQLMQSFRLIRYDCEQVRETTCSDATFLITKKKVCDLITNVLNNFYNCRNGQVEHLKKLEESISVYDDYMKKINSSTFDT